MSCGTRPCRSWWCRQRQAPDRKSTRLNSSHQIISYAVLCLKKKTCTLRHSITGQHQADANIYHSVQLRFGTYDAMYLAIGDCLLVFPIFEFAKTVPE